MAASGSEHTLAPRWLADEFGIDLDKPTDRLLLGVGGRAVEAVFAEVDLHLYRDHDAGDYVQWRTEVGFLHPWDAEFYLILGQIGFYDEYTVTMNRRFLTVRVQPVEALSLQDLRGRCRPRASDFGRHPTFHPTFRAVQAVIQRH